VAYGCPGRTACESLALERFGCQHLTQSSRAEQSEGECVTQMPKSGWYAAPGNPGYMQYWDGTGWTTQMTKIATHEPPIGGGIEPVYGDPNGRRYVTFTAAVRIGFRRYVDFRGRSSRSEYWWWSLFIIIVLFAPLLLGLILSASGSGAGGGLVLAVVFLVLLAIFLPSLAVNVRRFHDINKSGWWLLLPIGVNFIANLAQNTALGAVLSLVGFGIGIWFLVWELLPGDRTANRYGEVPHEGEYRYSGYAS